jgi:hypothetical protein
MSGRIWLAAASMWLVVGVAHAGAQTQTGEIVGRVQDGSGAALPGASVTLTGSVLLQPQTATSSESGAYQFTNLPIGMYSVRFELAGFKTLVREQVRVETGFSTQLHAQLEISTVQETVTVTSESPIIDPRRRGTSTTFTNDMLQNLPSARDPWVVLEQAPGIAMDRANVGGTQSGQQSNFISRGATTTNNMWSIDGVTVTDLVATGASAIYYDFDSFEEIQISTGGNDASLQTGGVGINLVTKSGSDRFKGSGRYYITDDRFQADNVDDELRAQNATSGNPIQRIEDYGFEAGGPLYRGRAWVWGSYGKQDTNVGILGFYERRDGCPTSRTDPLAGQLATRDLRACLRPDTTLLDNYNVKGSGVPFRGNTASWLSNFAEKFRNARDGSDLRPPETVFVQKGPVWTHKFSDQHVFTDRLLADLQVASVGGNFSLEFPDPALRDVQRSFELAAPAGLWGRSFQESIFDRPFRSVNANLSYFRPSFLGGDHAFKMGVGYRTANGDTTSHIGGNTTAQFTRGVATFAELHRDAATNYTSTNTSFFLQDTYTKGRLTALLGFRIDRQTDKALGASVEAHPFVPDLLPAASFDGVDPGVVWTDVSPRLGLTYDVTGSGRTIARASFSRYYGQMGPSTLSAILNPLTAVTLRLPWTDTNGDQFVQRSELNFGVAPTLVAGNWNAANPASPATANQLDPEVRNDSTDELIAGLEHQLGFGVAVGAAYIHREYGDFLWDDAIGIAAGDYSPVSGFVATGCRGGACPAITYYVPNFQRPTSFVRTNRPGRTRTFNGLELTARKRMSHNWMAHASFAYNDAVEHFDDPLGYGITVPVALTTQSDDPTETPFLDEAQYAPESSGSGIGAVFTNAKWVTKLSGMYSLPWGINVSGVYNARQGYPFIQAILVTGRPRGASNVLVPTAPIGESRLASFQQVDLKVEKVLRFGTTRISGSFEVFNLLNANTVLTRERQLNSNTAGDARGILAPRVARFGLKVNW